MADVEADVVVIGAGPVGAAVSWRLATQGLNVVCVERGDWVRADGLRRNGPDWELRRSRELHANPNIRACPDDDPIDDEDSPIKPMMAYGVGGTSWHWSAHVPRFRPDDFRVHSLDGVADDWPLRYEDLRPYYALNEERWGVASWSSGTLTATSGEGALELPTIGSHGRRLAAAFDDLGWSWGPVDLVVGRRAGDPQTEHCTHIGPCDLGCPSRMRSLAEQAYLLDALAAGARLMTRTRVLSLEHDAAGHVVAAVAATELGTVRVRGSCFVLAANGSSTPRLLLLSANGRCPNGLANGSGLVGRNLMLHPYARADGLFPEALGSWVSGEKAGFVSFEFYPTDRSRGFVRGLKLQLVTAPGPVALATGAVVGAPLPWGGGHHVAFEERFDHLCGLTVCAEDLPELENRIVLSDRVFGRDGLPAAKWIYRVSQNSRKILDFGLGRAEEILCHAGATKCYRTPLRDQAGFHIMGTARMGTDRETSVTNSFGRCHDVPNLFIADASTFVTSSAANPTATAQAVALRCADHIYLARRH